MSPAMSGRSVRDSTASTGPSSEDVTERVGSWMSMGSNHLIASYQIGYLAILFDSCSERAYVDGGPTVGRRRAVRQHDGREPAADRAIRRQRTAAGQAVNRADAPASTSITDPVMWRAPAETRYTTAAVTSSGSSQGTGCTWRPAMTGATSSLVACSRSGRISR